MDTKIQELTDKIYKEGVEKGNEEAGRIIADANAQKQAILTEAEAEAKRIVAQAEKQAAELKKNTEAELKIVCYPICRSAEERSGKPHHGKNYFLQCESDRF